MLIPTDVTPIILPTPFEIKDSLVAAHIIFWIKAFLLQLTPEDMTFKKMGISGAKKPPLPLVSTC